MPLSLRESPKPCATAAGLAAAIPAVVFYNLSNVFLSTCSDRLSVARRHAQAYMTAKLAGTESEPGGKAKTVIHGIAIGE